MTIYSALASFVRRSPAMVDWIKKAARKISPETVIILDYPVQEKPRWTNANPHRKLYEVIDQGRSQYQGLLQEFMTLEANLRSISRCPEDVAEPGDPSWINPWMPGMDGLALYGMIALKKPGRYMEVGSGNSTKFARKAIKDFGLDTKIISIDPCPRAEINALCDEVIRKPAEDVDVSLFLELEPGDILYVDNSHRVFMNSDATTMFLDVLPYLKPGVLVQFHDISLPMDYPDEWIGRYFSEQYVLAAFLLAKESIFDVVLPNTFISADPELSRILEPLWQHEDMREVPDYGCSFWIRTK